LKNKGQEAMFTRVVCSENVTQKCSKKAFKYPKSKVKILGR